MENKCFSVQEEKTDHHIDYPTLLNGIVLCRYRQHRD